MNTRGGGASAVSGSGRAPQIEHICRTRRVVQAVREGRQVVVEHVRLHVQRHRRGSMTEHPLRGLHVRARADRQRRGRVTKIVRRHGIQPALRHQIIATTVARQIRDASPSCKPRGLVVGKTSTNLVADPLSARSSAGDWFEMTGNTAGVTISFAADTSGELPAGRWTQWEFDATAAGGLRRFTVPNITPPAAGTRLVVAAHLQVEDVAGGWEAHVADGSAGLALNVLNANSGVGIATALQRTIGIRRTDTAAVYDIGTVVFPFDMPAGVTSMMLVFYLTLPTGDRVRLRAGAVGVLNATALGLASEFTYPLAPVNSPA